MYVLRVQVGIIGFSVRFSAYSLVGKVSLCVLVRTEITKRLPSSRGFKH